jgi:flavin reductase (DIM6/NTAB) family NADH-FMN oxidoreductase RutF
MTIMPSNNADVSASNLREVMSHYLTGVTIVTITKPDGTPYGLTVNSFNSVSLAPPLILWSLDNKNSNLGLFENTAGFAINIMAADQADLCRRFAGKDSDRFVGVDWTFGTSGQPLITHALAHIECRPWQTYAGGEHTIFVGEVLLAQHVSDRPAAAFFKGQLGHYES